MGKQSKVSFPDWRPGCSDPALSCNTLIGLCLDAGRAGKLKCAAVTHLLQDLRDRLVVGGDDGAVVVLQVLVDDGAATPDAEATVALPGGGRGRQWRAVATPVPSA